MDKLESFGRLCFALEEVQVVHLPAGRKSRVEIRFRGSPGTHLIHDEDAERFLGMIDPSGAFLAYYREVKEIDRGE